MNKNKILFITLCFSILLTLTLVIANDNTNNPANELKTNYGLCVREAAWVRQDCYSIAKENYSLCKIDALDSSKFINQNNKTKINKTELKASTKVCRDSYKITKSTCMNELKESKINCKPFKCKDNEIFNATTQKCDKNNAKPGLEKNFCDTAENGDVCTTIYQPVCGWFNSNINCIRHPCATTYSNSCFACNDNKVKYWTEGIC